jgi:hypothetical protein
MSKLINRLHLYPNQEIAKIEFRDTAKLFEAGKYGVAKIIVSDLVIECQGIRLQFRGIHDLDIFLRGRILDKVVSYTSLSKIEEMEILQRLTQSKILRPFEYDF